MVTKKNCLQCNKEFTKPVNESKKDWVNRHKYCSRKCADNSKIGKEAWNKGKKGLQKWTKERHEAFDGIYKGEKSPVWKGGRWRHYGKKVAFEHLPHKCDLCSKTNVKFQVHHKDKNIHNNTVENLQILCVTCHQRHHKLGVRSSPKTEFKKGDIPWNKKDIDMELAVKLRQQGLPYKKIGRIVGLSRPAITKRLKNNA